MIKSNCIDCGKEIDKRAERCHSCHAKYIILKNPNYGFQKSEHNGIPFEKGHHSKTEFQKGNRLGWKGGSKLSTARSHAKLKGRGFIPLNEWFEGSVGHHIDEEFVIFIPEKMHRSVLHRLKTGQNMDEINELAIDFCFGD